MANSPNKSVRQTAACYGILAMVPVGIFLILLQTVGWNLDWFFRNSITIGSELIGLLLLFLVNTALAFGAWNFVRLPRKWRVVVLTIAIVIAALCSAGIARDGWLWLHARQAFQHVDNSMILSSFGGRFLLSMGYILLAVQLAQAFRALKSSE